EVWVDIRERTELPTDLVAPLDRFIGRLLIDDPDEETVPCGLPPELPLTKACSPREVTELAQVWREYAGRIEELRPAIAAETAEYGCWFSDFDQVAMLLRDWGEIVEEADRRGWGVFYLTQ
ncbi:hypothetical protein ACFWFG_38875, partial [Streptomyces roseolus]